MLLLYIFIMKFPDLQTVFSSEFSPFWCQKTIKFRFDLMKIKSLYPSGNFRFGKKDLIWIRTLLILKQASENLEDGGQPNILVPSVISWCQLDLLCWTFVVCSKSDHTLVQPLSKTPKHGNKDKSCLKLKLECYICSYKQKNIFKFLIHQF